MSADTEVVWLMIQALPDHLRAEIKQALVRDLAPERTSVMEERIRELGELASLIAAYGRANRCNADLLMHASEPQSETVRRAVSTKRRWRVIPREIYDAGRSAAAPDSKRLVEKYGRWIDVCRAADGLYPDGRYIGIGRPWEVPDRHDIGRGRIYTDQDCLDAIRQCEQRIGRWPSSADYIAWRRNELKRLRRGRSPAEIRIPTYDVIKSRFGGWNRAGSVATTPP